MTSFPTEHEVQTKTNFIIDNIKTSSKYRQFICKVFSEIPKDELYQFTEFTTIIDQCNKNPPKETLSEEEYDKLMLQKPLGEPYCEHYGLR